MDKVLKALKEAEVAAESFEAEANQKATALVRAAEAESRKIELGSDGKAKAAGEKMLSEKVAEAKNQASKIMAEGKERTSKAEEKAKRNFESCVDKVVKATRESLDALEKE